MDLPGNYELRIMPTVFGAAGGPRQAPGEAGFVHGPTRITRYLVAFLGREEQVRQLIPTGLELRGDPVVQVHYSCLRDIPWLAGRGYNILAVLFPVRFTSQDGTTVDGLFQAVLWENLGDSIITGREQLGHAKLYAQLPDPREVGGSTSISASWDGFTFAELELSCHDVPDADFLEGMTAMAGAGLIGHKYIPRTGAWDVPDADYLTLTPLPGASNLRDPQPAPVVRGGEGSVQFHAPGWQDMPTQYHIVQKLAGLDQVSPLGAMVVEGLTYADAHDQRILR